MLPYGDDALGVAKVDDDVPPVDPLDDAIDDFTFTIDEVGNVAAFLCSDLASGITGETTFVDAGANIMGMVFDED